MKRSNRILAIVICILSLIALSSTAFAADSDINSESDLTIQFKYDDAPIAGAQFSVYLIADRSGGYGFELKEEFSGSSVGIDCDDQDEWKLCALALEAYAGEKGIEPVCAGSTDGSGKLTFNALKAGLYLVSGEKCSVGDTVYTSQAFIVALPELNAEGRVNTLVTANPKTVAEEKAESVSIRALKVWDDAGSESLRPESITVRLLCDGELYATALLSKDNSWAYTWEKLDADCRWLVSEDVPEGYTVKTEFIGDTFKITNTAKSAVPSPAPTPVPSGEKLPQTGQLWWPVPALMCAGLLCIVLGIVRRKESD